MPDFSSYPESTTIKMLYLGDSGAGKTGSLCALAAAGYNVRILDVDKGEEIIRGYLTHKDSIYLKDRPGLWKADPLGILKRISYVQVSDTQSLLQGKLVHKGDGFAKCAAQLTEWKDGGANYGPLEKWTTRDVLVIDSLSRLSEFALYQQLAMVGRSLKGPEQQDWWPAQNQVKNMLQLLTSEEVKCHVIVIGHVKYIEADNSIVRGMTQTLGKALSPELPQMFNNLILARSQGQGVGMKQTIITRTTGVIDLKNSAPLAVKPEYPLETGLAEYFQAILGRGAP